MTTARRPPGFVAPGPVPRGPGDDPSLAVGPDEVLSYLAGDWRLFQPARGHRWSLDDLVTAFVAARAVPATGPCRVVDLGSGLGSVPLLLAWRLPEATLTGIEVQAERRDRALRSIRYNGCADRLDILDGDFRETPLPSGADLVTGTPPYFDPGSPHRPRDAEAAACRFEDRGGVPAYLAIAARVVAAHGSIVLCAPARDAARNQAAAAAHDLVLVERLEIEPRAGKPLLITVDRWRPRAGLGPETVPTVDRLVVRDQRLAWTPAFAQVRAAFGMPTSRPAAGP